jgi:hypothetical protein
VSDGARGGRPWLAWALVALAVGCGDKAKVSEEKAVVHGTRLAQIAEDDVRQVRAGLPAGAKKLGERVFAAPGKAPTPAEMRTAMDKTRQAESNLLVAKSTFFAVTDPTGLVLASDREPDALAGKSLFGAFAGLAGAASGYVEALGEMPELRSVREGADGQWVASSVIAGEGGPKGYYVTGWAWRLFARHLEEQLKTEVRYEPGAKASELPLLYAFVVVGDRVYGTPTVAEVSRQAVEGLGLGAKVGPGAGATFRGRVEITGRPYGVGAARVPSLCERCLVVALRSEV